jgi:hypothetical protein
VVVVGTANGIFRITVRILRITMPNIIVNRPTIVECQYCFQNGCESEKL